MRTLTEFEVKQIAVKWADAINASMPVDFAIARAVRHAERILLEHNSGSRRAQIRAEDIKKIVEGRNNQEKRQTWDGIWKSFDNACAQMDRAFKAMGKLLK